MIDNEEMLLIVGGASHISGTLLKSIAKLINSALDVGRSLGSALRRVQTGNLCPA